LAHDLFEGVVCEVLTNVIRYCMTEGYFTLETLNDSILKFPFCRMDKSNKQSITYHNLLHFLLCNKTKSTISKVIETFLKALKTMSSKIVCN
jgi:hypothetical protein